MCDDDDGGEYGTVPRVSRQCELSDHKNIPTLVIAEPDKDKAVFVLPCDKLFVRDFGHGGVVEA